MKIRQKKIAAFAIAMFFALSMTVSIATVPNVYAHSPAWQIPTYAFVNVAPNPAGLNQSVNIGFWIQMPPPTAFQQYGDRWQNLKVIVTKPDGNTETLGPFTSDDTGGTHTSYIPTELGNYTFVFSFPGQTLAGNNLFPYTPASMYPNIGDYYEPSNATTTLTVQQQPIPGIPQNPLPTNYWTRPINAENNNWYSIAGNWLGIGQLTGAANTGAYNATGNYNPYTTAPTTAHILWTKPAAFGGTVGGEFGGSETGNFYSTRQYETLFAPIIINGIIYYTEYPGSSSYPAGWAAVDLQTGQTLWTDNAANYGGGSSQQTALTSAGIVTILRCGQILDYVAPNQYGSLAYLWSTGTPAGINAAPGTTTYNMFDAMTGNYILSIVNGTSMALTEDEGGNLIGYYTGGPSNAPTLNEWNSTQCIGGGFSWSPPQRAIIPFNAGIMWSMPIATNISDVPLPTPLALSQAGINGGVVLLSAQSNAGVGQGFTAGWQIEAGYSATTGTQLWITNRTETPYTRLAGETGNPSIGSSSGVYVEVNSITGLVIGYSIFTGAQLWTAQLPNMTPYDSIGNYFGIPANGVLYLWGFGGDMDAISLTNGTILWATSTTQIFGSSGSDTPYGVWPLWTWNSATVAGGLLYIPMGHEYSPPLFRGAQLLAFNTTNGQLVWSQLGFDVNSCPAISDGIMTTLNAYDNQIYAYGMGPSETTVTAPDIGVTTSTPVTITGTVMDISAGSQQNAVAMNSPHGLPCVSDASMTQWMEYVYMQQPMPTNATGVQVTLTAIDPNHNLINIGTATTDTSGNYGFIWTPPQIPGPYQITATFSGTNSYYSSSDTTYMNLQASATTAPTATPASNLATTSDLTLGIAVAVIAMIIAIAIVGLLIIRKKP